MILDKIVEKTKTRLEALKAANSLDSLKKAAQMYQTYRPFVFENALKTKDIAFICEVKKASPSKGVISKHFPYVQIAGEYEAAGANAISVLTEPDFFMGSTEYLKEIKKVVNIPVLRKDFIIDPCQIYESQLIGADAILLICSLLDTQELKKYIKIADSLGLSCLVEAHDENEITSAIAAGARIIGVNNRNLKTFEVDINASARLRELVPDNITFVSESGIKSADDISVLRRNGTNAVLIGETLMRSGNIKAEMDRLRANSDNSKAKIKICGLTRMQDIEYVNEALPDYAGFVFAKSRRQVSPENAAKLKCALDKRIQAVGVFVNEDVNVVAQICERGIIDIIQLHGDEDEAYINALHHEVSNPVIKAVRVKDKASLMACEHSSADFLLLDNYSENEYGGSGEAFDWKLASGIKKPYFLAGGISAENAQAAIKNAIPFCLDVSSGVETSGFKDRNKIMNLVNEARSVK